MQQQEHEDNQSHGLVAKLYSCSGFSGKGHLLELAAGLVQAVGFSGMVQVGLFSGRLGWNSIVLVGLGDLFVDFN